MQDLRDIMELLSSLSKGRHIDVITGGVFKLVFLLLFLAVIIPIAARKKYKIPKTLLIAASALAYLTYFSYTYMPLFLEPADFDYGYSSELIFKQMWPPLFQMSFFRDLSLILDIYLKPFALILAFSFISTIVFRKIRKPGFFAVFTVSAVLLEIIYVLVFNLLYGGLKYTYDLTLPFVEIPAFIIGYLLARLLIYLNKNLIERLHKPREPKFRESVI